MGDKSNRLVVVDHDTIKGILHRWKNLASARENFYSPLHLDHEEMRRLVKP
jgi:hypothetical protein